MTICYWFVWILIGLVIPFPTYQGDEEALLRELIQNHDPKAQLSNFLEVRWSATGTIFPPTGGKMEFQAECMQSDFFQMNLKLKTRLELSGAKSEWIPQVLVVDRAPKQSVAANFLQQEAFMNWLIWGKGISALRPNAKGPFKRPERTKLP